MPIDRLVLIIVVVLGAVGVTFWLGMMILASLNVPFLWINVIIAFIAGYIAWRVLEDRLSNTEDDYYDKIEK